MRVLATTLFAILLASVTHPGATGSTMPAHTQALDSSQLTLMECAEWFRAALAQPGKQRLFFGSKESFCDFTCTDVTVEQGVLRLDFGEECSLTGDVWARKRRSSISLADVDSERSAIIALTPAPGVSSGFNLHIVMLDGKTIRVRQVVTEKGATETKDFQHRQEEVYFVTEQQALQARSVLHRMVDLMSPANKRKD